MAVLKKIKRAIRGDVKLTTLVREVLRRRRAAVEQREERALVANNRPEIPLFRPPYAGMSEDELLHSFREEYDGHFLNGFHVREDPDEYRSLFSQQAEALPATASEIQWTCDPLSGYVWPLDYHRDIKLIRNDGSDVRVLWELNRLGHFIKLARAYALTHEERYSQEFFSQLRSWDQQNPYGRGPNWTCAMEVALRAMNLLGVFQIFRHSSLFDNESLQRLLRMFQQHGNYIERNLEFSHLATSNHYLSDVAGLLWLGQSLSRKFEHAERWRNSGLMALLGEMDKQVQADGSDFESSTGYHRFVTELFLYSFLVSENNNLQIEDKYWTKLHDMFIYMRSYLRPDGFAPLIGDTDSGQVFPIRRRRADDHAYLLALGAVVFKDPGLKLEGAEPPEELFWILGEEGVKAFQEMSSSPVYSVSKAFRDAGVYLMREDDLYLCFNASDAGLNGRGSHGHNDALSIEISASGHAFIVDPGTYVYSADLDKRHAFRSTAYHSTVRIDGEEQNTTDRDMPFVIGNEAKPRVLEWQTGADFDKVVAEHYGYMRLAQPVTHRRSVTFNKRERSWLIEDEFIGEGEHICEMRFHFAPDVDVRVSGSAVEARIGDAMLVVKSDSEPVLESQPVSRDYGEMSDAVSVYWVTRMKRMKTLISIHRC
jgi:Heparinase II/III-like protein/Heparinase II/III N-terminus